MVMCTVVFSGILWGSGVSLTVLSTYLEFALRNYPVNSPKNFRFVRRRIGLIPIELNDNMRSR